MSFFFGGLKALFLCGVFLFSCALNCNAQGSVKFIENKNQWPSDVHFAASVPGGKMFVGPASLKYVFLDYNAFRERHHRAHELTPDEHEAFDLVDGHSVFVSFPGADISSRPQPFGRSEEYYNYFRGNDARRWASKAYAYEGMFYESFFPGVDLKIYSAGENVKYDFVVAPNADPSVIRASYEGADAMSLDNGNLFIRTPLAEIAEKRPVAWQWMEGRKVDVPCAFHIEGNVMSFVFPEGFDSCYELVIDPLLIFSTYSGSTADNWGSTATPGEHGNLYSAGVTNELQGGQFPATAGAFQTEFGGYFDIAILKYDSLGSNLLFATYLGGQQAESPHSLIMNAAEELIVLGSTSSNDFPTTSTAFDQTFNGGPMIPSVVGYTYGAGSDVVISRFSKDGTQLLSSTFMGGAGTDGLNPRGGDLEKNYGDQIRGDIITDDEGNIYVSSVTSSIDFPIVNGFNTTYLGGATDAVLFKMDPDFSQVLWGTFIGGTGADAAYTLKLDNAGDIFIAGGTTSADFPAEVSAYQPLYAGQVDGWIAKIAGDGASILHATYTGTAGYNQIYFLDLNDAEEVYVYGQTAGGTFPVTPEGVYLNPGSGQFVQKFDNTLENLGFSTVFGASRGIPDISPTAFLVNDCNNIYMAGWGGRINQDQGYWNSNTIGMHTTSDAFQRTTSGSDFYFIVLTEDGREQLYGTFLGGGLSRTHVDGGTSRFDKGGIVYHSVCSGCISGNASGHGTSDFPTTEGAWSRVNRSANCNNAAFKFDLSSLKARLRTNSVRRDMPGLNIVCIPEAIVFENVSIGGELFEWDFGDGTEVATTDTAAMVHFYEEPGQYLVKLKAIDKGTCKAVDSVAATVTINIAKSSVQDDDDLCIGDPYMLQAGGAATYTWVTADGKFISGSATPVVSPQDTTTYYITLEEANGCVLRDTVQLNVIPAMTPEFEWTKAADCLGRPEIHVRNVTDSVRADDVMFFDFGDGTTTDHIEDKHYFDQDGVYNIRLVSQRAFCGYEKAVSIPVFEMFVPNVITPGTPGHNDVFTIRYGKEEGVTPGDYGFNVALTIYNRWGQEVFSADQYQYDWSGEGLAPGTYYYDVDIEGHATCKGWLHLLK